MPHFVIWADGAVTAVGALNLFSLYLKQILKPRYFFVYFFVVFTNIYFFMSNVTQIFQKFTMCSCDLAILACACSFGA